MRRSLILLIPGAVLIGSLGAVTAFPANQFWHMPSTGVAGVNRAGAGGIYGTGGQLDKGIKCSHCHIEPEGLIDVSIGANPPFQDLGGEDAYVPGTRYTITVSMIGEHLAVGPTNNRNLMALAIENASGERAGRFIADAGQDTNNCPTQNPYQGTTSPVGKTTFMYGDCHGVLALDHMGRTSWTFDWIAPAAGEGEFTMFVGMVDGNSGGDSSLGDDVVERALPLREGS